jgi:hypothetical protein
VENHMPQVIIVDEIGTALEAEAARTIAERGVQLVGTAHGNSLENLTINPTLSDLIGGIQSVTLGDEEARRRHTQKSILERKAPPTFDILVEIQERDQVIVHPDVGQAVDAILQAGKTNVEERRIDPDGNVVKTESIFPKMEAEKRGPQTDEKIVTSKFRIFLFGVNKNKLEEAARERHIGLKLTNVLEDANLLLTTKNYFMRKPQILRDAEKLNIPIYAVRSSNVSQLRHCLEDIYWKKKDSLSENKQELEKPFADKNFTPSPEEDKFSSYIQDLQNAINKYGNRKGSDRNKKVFRRRNSKSG